MSINAFPTLHSLASVTYSSNLFYLNHILLFIAFQMVFSTTTIFTNGNYLTKITQRTLPTYPTTFSTTYTTG